MERAQRVELAMAGSFSSESLDEKFTKPLLRMVVGCLDIMMPRKNGKSASTEVGLPKYNFDEATKAIKSGVLYFKQEIDMKPIVMKTEESSSSPAAQQRVDSSPLSSPARRVGGSPSLMGLTRSNEKMFMGQRSVKSEKERAGGEQKLVIHCVRWDQLEQIMLAAVDCKHAEISAEVQAERYYFETEEAAIIAKHKLKCFQSAISDLPSVSGKWNRAASELRRYQSINGYVPTENIPVNEQTEIVSMLETPLQTAYLGQPYNFDDGALTEEWMCTFADKHTGKTLPEEDIVKVLTSSTLDMVCEQVMNRVCSESGVLDAVPLNLRQTQGNGEGEERGQASMDVDPASHPLSSSSSSSFCVEQPVFGIDCACRRLIEVVLVDRLGADTCTPMALKLFIERKLLPGINKLPGKLGHSMLKATESLCSPALVSSSSGDADVGAGGAGGAGGENGGATEGLLRLMATTLHTCVKELGIDSFKIHPKGSGVVCAHPDGIAPHQVVCEYLGELYPPYRWCERQAVVEQAQHRFKLKPALPDFYNILLERPRQDPRGYGLLFVDASDRANVGSTLSHSCENNCTSAVVSRGGKLSIVLTTTRFIHPGEELTHDYAAVTSSEDEWRSAVCLCGMTKCRGSFLHFAAQNDLQQILEQNCSPLYRYSSLLKACSNHPLHKEASDALNRHGMLDVAFGKIAESDASVPLWARKFASDMLRFIEYERQALPCALMREPNEISSSSSPEAKKEGSEAAEGVSIKGEEVSPDAPSSSAAEVNPLLAFETTYAIADMDARSVMEQRVQSLCCALSMTQRYFSKQPPPLHVTASSRSSSSLSKEEAEGRPLELLSSHNAVQFLLDIVEEIPTLMRQYLLKEEDKDEPGAGSTDITTITASSSSTGAAAKKGAGKKKKGGKENKDTEGSSPKAANNSKVGSTNDGKAADVTAAVTAAAAASAAEKKKKQARDAKKREAILQEAIRKISTIVTTFGFVISAPTVTEERKSIMAAHRMILEVREVVLSIVEYANRKARLRQLADVLGLLAHTHTFSRPAKFSVVHSEAIQVPCRELGMNIRRCDIVTAHASNGNGSGNAAEMKGKDKDKEVVPASELVHSGTKRYGAYFAFEQMMGWYTAGEGSAAAAATAADGEEKEEKSGGNSETGTGIIEKKGKASKASGKDKSSANSSKAKVKNEKDDKEREKGSDGSSSKSKGGSSAKATCDLFGSTQMPRPWQCFGASETAYSTKQRGILLDILRNEKQQCLPWPSVLRGSFNHSEDRLRADIGEAEADEMMMMDVDGTSSGAAGTGIGGEEDKESADFWKARVDVFGSPMLDVSLGKTQAVKEALHEISEKDAKAGRTHCFASEAMDVEQFDERLPPEANSQWVSCDKCHRWRRLPFHVDIDSLDDDWTCDKNTWEPEKASCAAPPDDWDPDTEDIADFSGGKNEGVPPKIGEWRDVFCPRNLVYYEGQILKVREAKPLSTSTTTTSTSGGEGQPDGGSASVEVDMEYFVHFKGFKKGYDEWVRSSTDRIRPHNMFTSVLARTVAEQQAYQGMHVMSKGQKKKAAKDKEDAKKRKRKGGDGDEEDASKKDTDNDKDSKKPRVKRPKKEGSSSSTAGTGTGTGTGVPSLSAEYDALVSSDDEAEAAAEGAGVGTAQKSSIADAAPRPLSVTDLEAQYDALDTDSEC